MRDFRELKVWEKSHNLILKVYQITKDFPREELYGLTSQLRRAGASIPTNIAEGCGRKTDVDLSRFLNIAFASASELEYLLLLARDLKLIEISIYNELTSNVVEIKKMLFSLMEKINLR